MKWRPLIWLYIVAMSFDANAQNEQTMFWALNQSCSGLMFTPATTPALPTVVVAYGIRKLVCGYEGYAMRVRRSGDNAEVDVSFTSANIVAASSIVKVTRAGTGLSVGTTLSFSSFIGSRNIFVKIWYDQSGNGNDAVQNTRADQPQIVQSGTWFTENGYPTIEFDGMHTDIWLDLSTSLNLSNGSLFGVYKVVNGYSTCGIAENGTYSYNLNTYNTTGKIGVTHYGVLDVPSTINYNTTTLDLASWSKSSANNYVETNTHTASATCSINMPIAISQVYGNALSGTTLRISEFIVTGYAATAQRGKIFTDQRTFFNTP